MLTDPLFYLVLCPHLSIQNIENLDATSQGAPRAYRCMLGLIYTYVKLLSGIFMNDVLGCMYVYEQVVVRYSTSTRLEIPFSELSS